jgi:hypothetical protein
MSGIVGTLHGSRECDVAIVGNHMWAANTGLDALIADWEEGANADVHPDDIWRDPRLASEKGGIVAKSQGDIAKGLLTGKFERRTNSRLARDEGR